MFNRSRIWFFLCVAALAFVIPALLLAQEIQQTQQGTPAAPVTEEKPIMTAEPPAVAPAPPQPQFQPSDVQPHPGAQPLPAPGFMEEEPARQEFVDPREIKDVLRQIREVRQETQRLIKRARKISGAEATVGSLQELVSVVDQHETAIKGAAAGDQRDAIQEFHDARVWDTLESARIQVELPQQLKDVERELKRVEKLIASKGFAVEGLNLEGVKGQIAEVREAVASARQAMAAGDAEAAREAMQAIFEGSHPGEIYGVLQQLREITRSLKRIRSTEVKAAVLEILSPVFEAANEGDFREANFTLNEIRNDLFNIINRLQRTPRINEDMRKKIQQLEEKLMNRLENQQSAAPYYYYQRASVLDAIRSWLGW